MRFLVVGAGALGGYFGGRLLAARRDVTFLLRRRRAAQIERTGLVVRSAMGDLHLPSPPHLLSQDIDGPYDVVIVGCKAYDLAETMDSFAAAVGPNTVILPMLNGMRHLDQLAERFGKEKVLGGYCMISATLDDEGAVVHIGEMHGLTFGELDGSSSPRVAAIAAEFEGTKCDANATPTILQEMWEKWMFIASLAGITCLMRATVGDIVAAGGKDVALALFDECSAIAAHHGFAPRQAAVDRGHAILTTAGSPLTASMYKDVARGAAVEADHILGDLLARSKAGATASVLRTAYVHLKTYEAQRARLAASNTAKA
ncbi:MAG: 2-dehydropantoate 2-reductase [Comamonadaceae bacterium]|nr:MAG: 2-dehydropantoate 2-reductase [Comamonadaceae bacterium]